MDSCRNLGELDELVPEIQVSDLKQLVGAFDSNFGFSDRMFDNSFDLCERFKLLTSCFEI